MPDVRSVVSVWWSRECSGSHVYVASVGWRRAKIKTEQMLGRPGREGEITWLQRLLYPRLSRCSSLAVQSGRSIEATRKSGQNEAANHLQQKTKTGQHIWPGLSHMYNVY